MNLIDRIKHGAAVVLGVVLTIAMFPLLLATTTFLLLTGFVGAIVGAYRFRQLVKQTEQTEQAVKSNRQTSAGQTIEGTYTVVDPVN